MHIPTKSGESVINPGFGGCKDLFGCLEPNLGPLQKKHTLLSAKISLQPQDCSINKHIDTHT